MRNDGHENHTVRCYIWECTRRIDRISLLRNMKLMAHRAFMYARSRKRSVHPFRRYLYIHVCNIQILWSQHCSHCYSKPLKRPSIATRLYALDTIHAVHFDRYTTRDQVKQHRCDTWMPMMKLLVRSSLYPYPRWKRQRQEERENELFAVAVCCVRERDREIELYR